jgi:prephenate dehydrogenase
MIKGNIPQQIGIIGGNGQIGRRLCDALKKQGYGVMISDITTSISNTQLAGQCDIVIVSVPIHATQKVLEEVAPCMRAGTLLTDVTSVKTFPLEVMRKNLDKDVAFIGGHPLFAPSLSWDGQHFILCAGRENDLSVWYREFLISLGLTIIDMTAQEHDRHMAVIQCLTHFSNLALGHTLHTLNYDLAMGEKISTAVYRMRLYGVGRILAQDPELYADIQKYNPYAKEVTAEYARAVDELLHAIDRTDDRSFAAIFARSKRYFGTLTTRSERITNALIAVMKKYE